MEQGHDRNASSHHLPAGGGRDRRPGKDRKYDDDPYRGSQRPGRRGYGDRYPEDDSRRRRDKSRDDGSRYERLSRDDRSSSREDRPRDESRGRHREDYQDRRYDRPRDSHHYRKDGDPSKVILLRNLGVSITDDMIRKELEAIHIFPIDIRLIVRDNEQKRFAFIEFSDEAGGVEFMSATGGMLKLGGDWCSLAYSVPRKGRNPWNDAYSDWPCPVCPYLNFGRRRFCQKCGTSQDASKNFPTEVVLLKNLDIIVTEESVLSLLGQLTTLPIKSLKIPKDPLLNVSLGYCLVEMNSFKEAVELHDLLISMGDNFTINEKPVEVTYWRKLAASQSENAKAKASLALSAAQWTNQSQVTSTPYSSYYAQDPHASSYLPTELPDLGTINIGGVIYKRYPAPDVSTFRYDATSGFHYDCKTGFYYDPKSTYYFNNATQQYMYWEGSYQTYIPVPSTTSTTTAATSTTTSTSTAAVIAAATTVEPASTVGPKQVSPPPESSDADGKGKKKDKSKLLEAKKISKDMERWAKMQDKKRDIARQSQQIMQAQISRSSAEDVGYLVLEKEASKTLKDIVLGQPKRDEETVASTSLAILADYGEDDNTDTVADDQDDAPRSEEELAKLIDWEKLACLLCKRKFSSREILSKHEKQSDLHIKNLEALRATKTSQGSSEQERVFRDRARERREKYGQPEVPMPSTGTSLKRKQEEESIAYEEPTRFGIGSDNIGNKMLKAMGWNEGQGLGRENQGTTEILGVSQRSGSTGLGAPNPGPTTNTPFDYRKYGKKLMHSRYYELP